MNGGTSGATTTFDVRCHIFEYHNGIIHHHTNGHGQGAERNDVQTSTRSAQVYKGSNERNRNCNNNNNRCTPASEEGQHHKNNEKESIHYRFGKSADGELNVFGSIHDHIQFHIRWQVLLYFG